MSVDHTQHPEPWWKQNTEAAVERIIARFDGRADYLKGPVTDDEYRLYGEISPGTAAAMMIAARSHADSFARAQNQLRNAIGSAAGR